VHLERGINGMEYEIIRLSPRDGTHEVTIEMDPNVSDDSSNQLHWRFHVEGGRKVSFTVVAIEESENTQTVVDYRANSAGSTYSSSSSSTSAAANTTTTSITTTNCRRSLDEVVLRHDQQISEGNDSCTWTHHSKGLVLLTWSHPEVQDSTIWNSFYCGSSVRKDIVLRLSLTRNK